MKKSKIFLTVLPILVCMFFFSIGFASWTVVVPVSKSTDTAGDLIVDKVYNSTDYITVDSIAVFDYSSLHFLNSGKASDSGSVIVTCTVDLEKCRSRFEEKNQTWSGKLTVSTSLTYANVIALDGSESLFAEINDGTYYRKVTANIKVGDSATACTVNNGGSFVTATGTLENLASTGMYTFGLEFVISIPEDMPGTDIPANFRHCFGQYLKSFTDDKTEFIAAARITETE